MVARVKVWWWLGLSAVIYIGVVLNSLSYSPFMILNAHKTFKPL
jgi:hypothetical protein